MKNGSMNSSGNPGKPFFIRLIYPLPEIIQTEKVRIATGITKSVSVHCLNEHVFPIMLLNTK